MSGVNGYRPLPPANMDHERGGPVKWPWFSARRRGHLLELQVQELERRLEYVERYMSGPPPHPKK